MHKIALRVLMFVLVVLSVSSTSLAQLRISVSFGPPAIPVYEQPICPGDGYIWTPGYWAWDDDDADYYWVPGTWVLGPEVGFLWTPPWWGWEGGVYLFHEGWWGPHVGFYGGINYGFGYFGTGFVGGRWDGGHFFYNRSVANINVVNIHNVYNETVVVNNNHVSFNGGPGGISARASAEEERWGGERHIAAVSAQTQHIQAARSNRDLRASVNNGRPSIAATARPGDFREGAVAAREAGGEYHPPANRAGAGGGEHGGMAPNNAVHPKELPPVERAAPPNTGNAAQDRKLQQQQQKMYAKQDQERQKLQQKQEQEHQRMQNAPAPQRQQMEQRHQQQTQQLQQRHVQQQQSMQQRTGGGGGKPR
jgi:WXXGXW repeat (2 copies)